MASVQTSGTLTTEGREGLVVPTIEWNNDYSTEFLTRNMLEFFRDLWMVNGFEPKSTDDYQRRVYNIPYDNLLAIPEDGTRPALIIKGVLTRVDSKKVERERILNDAQSRTWQHSPGVTTGHEAHGIYRLPAITGPLVPLVEIEEKQGQSWAPVLRKHSVTISRHNYEQTWSVDGSDEAWEARMQNNFDAFNSVLKTILSETVELLS